MADREEGSAEALLQRVLVGELSVDDPLVEARSREDPEFRRTLQGSLGTQRLLELDARDEREALEESAASVDRPAPQRGFRNGWPLALVAAALVATLVISLWVGRGSARDRSGPAPVMLGQRVVPANLSPSGPEASFSAFSFEARMPAGSYGVLRVWVVDAPATGNPVLEKRFGGTTCSLSDDEVQLLPDEIRWEIRLFDVEGAPIGFAEVVSASR